jgi:hypothetical protein
MRQLHGQILKVLLTSALVGCGFTPGAADGVASGGGGSSGNSTASGGGGVNGGGGTLGVGLTGGGGDVGFGSGGSTTCGTSKVPVAPAPPDILLVQDKSGSMSNDDTDTACNGGCGANSKWSQLTTAVSTVVQATQANVNWGLKFFSDNNACDASMAPVVPIAAMNATAVVNAIAATQPGANTPTRDAVTNGAAYLATVADTNQKYLLLATDGLPNCPSGCAAMAKPSTMCTMTDNPNEDMAAEAAILMAAMQGYKTFVIGIGNVAVATNTLNQFAINGGEAQTGAATSYYAATDETAFENALNSIVGLVASCTIPLPSTAQGQSNVAVSVDNAAGTATKVPEDPTNGWSYTDSTMTAIQLNGSSCADIKNGTYTNIQFLYACAGMPICIDKLADGTCGDSS